MKIPKTMRVWKGCQE